MNPTEQWIAGIIIGLAFAVIGYYVRSLDKTIDELKKIQEEHRGKDDERFEKCVDRIREFEKEFSAEVREALSRSHDRHNELKDWVREKHSK